MKARGDRGAREYFRAFYYKNHWRFAVGMIMMALMGGTGLAFSWILGEVIDIMFAGDLGRVGALAAIAAGTIAATFLVDVVGYRMRVSFLRRALTQYKALAFTRLTEKSISAFSRENTGRYLSVLTNDVNTIEENYLNRSFLLLYYCVSFVAALGMMVYYSPALAAAAIGLGLLPILAAVGMGGELARRESRVSDQNEKFVARLKDILSGFSVVKSFKAEGETQRLFEASNEALEGDKARRRWWDLLIFTVGSNLGSVVQTGVFVLGAVLSIQGDITAGTVVIIVNLCNFILQPIQQVPQFWAGRKAARGLVEKLAAVTEENSQRTGERILPKLDRAIRLENVTFGYTPETPVVKGVSLTLEAGKKYALVGGSGSGKTTLLNLLMGGYEGYEGSITIDDRELRDIDPDSLYDLMSLIGQNVFLFDDTIRQNVTMFRDFPEQVVTSSVKRSGLTELIEEKGEDYRCGENGGNLSGGERQRVSIARCLLRGTPVLLLDEATASLDNQTAHAVTQAILGLEGLTRLVVTHRLEEALLEQYDRIFVMREGRLYEQGSFRELMEEKGYFYSLYHVTNG